MKPGDINPLAAGLAVLLLLLGATAGFLGLDALARPTGFGKRVAAAEALQTAVTAPAAGPRRFADTAVCAEATVAASQTVRKTIAALAARHELNIADLQASPAAPERALADLGAVDVQLSAVGRQSNIMALIADLEAVAPMVFLDRLELRPKGGQIELKLTGRAFCAISTRR